MLASSSSDSIGPKPKTSSSTSAASCSPARRKSAGWARRPSAKAGPRWTSCLTRSPSMAASDSRLILSSSLRCRVNLSSRTSGRTAFLPRSARGGERRRPAGYCIAEPYSAALGHLGTVPVRWRFRSRLAAGMAPASPGAEEPRPLAMGTPWWELPAPPVPSLISPGYDCGRSAPMMGRFASAGIPDRVSVTRLSTSPAITKALALRAVQYRFPCCGVESAGMLKPFSTMPLARSMVETSGVTCMRIVPFGVTVGRNVSRMPYSRN